MDDQPKWTDLFGIDPDYPEPSDERGDDVYIAVDANCPGCGHPERRARFDEHGAVFSCRNCPYISRERDA